MQTLPMSGVALASETRPVDARNPERSIVARSTALSLVFNYRLASSAFSSDSTGSEIYMRWESHFSIFLLAEGFPFDEEALRLLISARESCWVVRMARLIWRPLALFALQVLTCAIVTL